MKNAETTHETTGVWGVSVQAGADVAWAELAAALPHPRVCVTTAGRLRAAGFEVTTHRAAAPRYRLPGPRTAR